MSDVDIGYLVGKLGLLIEGSTQREVITLLQRLGQDVHTLASRGVHILGGGGGGGGGGSGMGQSALDGNAAGPGGLPANEMFVRHEEELVTRQKKVADEAEAAGKKTGQTFDLVSARLNKFAQTMSQLDIVSSGFSDHLSKVVGKIGGLRQAFAEPKINEHGINVGGVGPQLAMAGLIANVLYKGMDATGIANSKGNQYGQVFERTGVFDQGQATEIGQLAVSLEATMPGAERMVAATMASMAAAGITAKEGLTKNFKDIDGSMHNTIEALTLLDAGFDLSAGTMAKMAGELNKMSGQGFTSAAQELDTVGRLARGTSQDFEALLGSITHAASGMRMQVQDGKALTAMYMQLQGGAKGYGNQQKQNAMAAEAFNEVTAKIGGGMSQAYQGHFAEELAKKYGVKIRDAADAIYQFQTGFAEHGKQETFPIDVFNLLSETIRRDKNVTSEGEAFMRLQGPGLDFTPTTAAIYARKIMSGKTFTEEDFKSEEEREALGALGVDEGGKRSPMEAMQKAITDTTEKMSQLLVATLVYGFNTLITLSQATVAILSDPKNIVGIGDEKEKALAAVFVQKEEYNKTVKAVMDSFEGPSAEAVKRVIETALPKQRGKMSDEELKAFRTRPDYNKIAPNLGASAIESAQGLVETAAKFATPVGWVNLVLESSIKSVEFVGSAAQPER